jgi:hypothetical protein
MKKILDTLFPYLSAAIAILFLTNCGKREIAIGNSAFTGASSFVRMAVDPVTEFKFCVARVRLESQAEKEAADASGSSEDDSSYTQFAPGLIDVSAGTAKDWGAVALPEKAQVVRIKVKVKKDESVCGTDYSVMYNGMSTPRDIEFRWKFEPAIDVSAATVALRLSFDEIVAALQGSAMSDELQLKDRIEAVESTAAVE